MRVVFVFLVLSLLVLPLGCGGGDAADDAEGTPAAGPETGSAEELETLLPPPE